MIRVNLKNRINAYYIRWYYEGWHSHLFAGADESLITSGEVYRTNVDYELSLGDENLTKSELYAISGLLEAKYIQMLTSDGWKFCTIGNETFNFGRANRIGASVAFRIKVWAKVGKYTPMVFPTITPPPTPIITLTESLTAFSAIVGYPSTSQSYLVEGNYLQSNIVITAPSEFEISTDDSTWVSAISLTQIGGVASDTIYIRLNPTVGGSGTKTLTHQSTNAETKTITLNYTSTAITAVKYGSLYNWYAATDVRGIANGDFDVPTDAQLTTLITYLGGASVAGGKLKEMGFTYWDSPNTGATNEVGFNGRGNGIRNNGIFTSINRAGVILRASQYDANNMYFLYMRHTFNSLDAFYSPKHTGVNIRLLRPATPSDPTGDGSACDPYIGNDLKVYRTVKIGTQVWTADNLAETKYANGDTIPTVTDNAAWAALTTGAKCAYDNNESYVLI